MKNSVKLSVLAFVLAVSITACGDGDKAKSQKPDSAATSTVTKVTDTIQKDTTGKVVGEKKDSTVTKKSKSEKVEKK